MRILHTHQLKNAKDREAVAFVDVDDRIAARTAA